MERVKYYSPNDLTCGRNLKNSEILINEYESGNKEAYDINDIIELYNIKKYFDNKLYLMEWTLEDIKRFEKNISVFFGIIARYIKVITDDKISEIYDDIIFYYKDDFWELIDRFKVYEDISEQIIQELLFSSKIKLSELLKSKNIVEHYGRIIREYMLSDSSSAKLLLDKYEMKHFRQTEEIHLPKELSIEDKETTISNYIDCDQPNPNYLQLIANIQSNKDKLVISPKLILKSKKKIEEQEKEFFKDNSGMRIETSVIFASNQENVVSINNEGLSTTGTYNSNWIRDNLDYATLLNNFIYLFEYVDLQMRCTLVNKESEMGVFERHILTSSKNAYVKGFSFEHKNNFSYLQMAGYYDQLFRNGIRLEEVIEWFFVEYLSTEFGATNFRVSMPSASSTFLEKCTNVMPALESVLKQFILYIEEGHIDIELFEIRSEHLIYRNIPSLIDNKYVYGIGDEFRNVTFLLFSDQSGLGYIDETKKTYDCFFELLCNEKVKISDYPEFDTPKIEWLIKNNYLTVDEAGLIVFPNEALIILLYELYTNDVIAYWKYSFSGRKILNELKDKNILEFESTLFSRPEQEYINYLLNKSQFNNGLDLRNKYSHLQPFSADDENKHTQNYYIFLRLFIITVIKINDEFCSRKLEDGPNIT
ncbi:hypothetical protein [Paenibacillus physcomitrellae]|uniref:DUF4209 domain-containing protein n=1 Tax=Paenibacillus physcomitrellae TaxID=1619311 RepID=A0ABQ1GBS2_9BACL|nr:hypothetical protein [Paenibacillus physcomitrellae]GGA40578.1 hypothetical protein GCM10010917_27260 [Paenibacillus physcomitrellae]